MLEGYIKLVRRLLPSPFSIAIILSIVTIVAVLFYSHQTQPETSISEILSWWQNGLWTNSLLVFAVQMMLMLVLGHVLALSPFTGSLIEKLAKQANSSAKAAALVSFSTLLVGLFNWGLGLIFGAILARKIGELASKNKIQLNYALIGAAGYSALMIWHGGLSGSALIKVAEPGHLAQLMSGSNLSLPEVIGLNETVFSPMNIITSIGVIILVPFVLYLVGKKTKAEIPQLKITHHESESRVMKLIGAEHIDHSPVFSKITGAGFTFYSLYLMLIGSATFLAFFTPNNINFLLLALGLLAHKNMVSFLTALEEAIVGASGILIQFPLYFGIMGLMKESGLIEQISIAFVSISNEFTYPLFTFVSAGLVNIFVPSGGGQWAIQGPILLQSASELGVPLNKSILALAYGDQITNMLQPFWALPLLGITKLSARDILPYTLVMFVVGFLIYLIGLMIF